MDQSFATVVKTIRHLSSSHSRSRTYLSSLSLSLSLFLSLSLSLHMVSRFEEVLFHCGLFSPIFSYLTWSDLIKLEQMTHLCYQQIRVSEPIWRAAAHDLLLNKEYVKPIVKRLIHEGNRINYRVDLMSMTIRELKHLANFYGVNITTCFEKGEIIAIIDRREMRNKLPVECLAHFAVRIAWLDRKRNCITEEDLCAYEWNIRVRSDGPLQTLMTNDPWWINEVSNDSVPAPTTTLVRFFPNGEFLFVVNGMTPLESILANPNERFSYSLEKSGSIVSLSIGVREYVARHPVNWGFVHHKEPFGPTLRCH
jgi:hypothetical protein